MITWAEATSVFSVQVALPPLNGTVLQTVVVPSLKVTEPCVLGLIVLGLFPVRVTVKVTDWP